MACFERCERWPWHFVPNDCSCKWKVKFAEVIYRGSVATIEGKAGGEYTFWNEPVFHLTLTRTVGVLLLSVLSRSRRCLEMEGDLDRVFALAVNLHFLGPEGGYGRVTSALYKSSSRNATLRGASCIRKENNSPRARSGKKYQRKLKWFVTWYYAMALSIYYLCSRVCCDSTLMMSLLSARFKLYADEVSDTADTMRRQCRRRHSHLQKGGNVVAYSSPRWAQEAV